jgi:hypothetical protein
MLLVVSLEEDQVFVTSDLIDINSADGLQLRIKGWTLEFGVADAWCRLEIEVRSDYLIVNNMRVEEEIRLEFNGAVFLAFKE